MTLHEIAVVYVATTVNGKNNHYNPTRYKVGQYFPDVVVFNDDKVTELHEVETVPIRILPPLKGVKRVLWFALRKKGWDEFKVLYVDDTETDKIEQTNAELLHSEATVAKLKEAICSLEQGTRFLRERRLQLKRKNTIKLFYQLPYLEFKKEMNPDICIICSSPSAIIIDAAKAGTYGLCDFHFTMLINVEERKVQ